jgi:hypothetical protein
MRVCTFAFVVIVFAFLFWVVPARGDVTGGLVAHWTFDDGTAHDSAGTNNGTIYGAVPAASKIGGSLNFDGINDYVQVNDNTSLDITNAITISAWVKRDLTGVRHNVVCKTTNTMPYDGYHLIIGAADEVAFTLAINGHWNGVEGGAIDAGNWHHLAGTYDGTQLTLYIDGSPVVSEIDPGTIGVNNQNLYIGRAVPNYGYFFDGNIDDVRIYNRALNGNEVQQLYNIPEPATLLLLGLGGVMLRKHR